ncbi:MAG: SIR2 family protein [Luteibacter jiangsuensis]
MSIEQELTDILRAGQAGPFLFVGSGFSRRYVGLEDWKGLLSRFCVAGRPFEYYLSAADGDYPKAASLLAEAFNEYWWSAPEYADAVTRDKGKISGITSALRLEISRYLSTLDQGKAKASKYAEEIELLAGLNVDGVITTNWDLLLEQIFPDYRVFIGQEELLFSNPQQIGEIYKIHGCSKAPSSLVLTSDDYKTFHERNAYLAAKLITIFVEHPIVFLGYSISDENILGLLRAISLCIGKENVEQLRRNLIFVQRLETGDNPGISDTYLTIDGVQIPLVLVKSDDFKPVYSALGAVRRKIPARVLRYCKEQLYSLVKSAEPEKKLCVIDYEDVEKNAQVEFLVGVGVTELAGRGIGEIGYGRIEAIDLFSDLLHNSKKFDAKQILENVIQPVGKSTKNIPVFKYLAEIGIVDLKDYRKSGLPLDRWVLRPLDDFKVKSYAAAYFKRRHMSLQELIDSCTAESASLYIPWMAVDKIDLDVLLAFLRKNEAKMDYRTSPYASNFRKVATLYDRIKWGWKA